VSGLADAGLDIAVDLQAAEPDNVPTCLFEPPLPVAVTGDVLSAAMRGEAVQLDADAPSWYGEVDAVVPDGLLPDEALERSGPYLQVSSPELFLDDRVRGRDAGPDGVRHLDLRAWSVLEEHG